VLSWLILAVSLPVQMLLVSCLKEDPPEPEVVAKVDDRALTVSEVNAWEASLGQAEVPQEVRSEFIRRWVEEEILYKAAIERKLDDDPWIVQTIDELSRTLMVNRLLELEAIKLTTPTAGEIRDYFQAHSAEFVWSSKHHFIEYWSSADKKGMNRLRSNLLRGNNSGIWGGDIGALDNSRISLDGQESTTPQIWKVVNSMKVGETSRVLYLNERYWVFKLIERFEPGELKGLENVQEEIRDRLMNRLRQELRDNFVKTLVDGYLKTGKLQWSEFVPVVTVLETTDSISENSLDE